MYKNKKVKKYRGSKTHGGGSMKKRRGAGNRGGRGRAGGGKKGDQNKPRYWKDPAHGKGVKGFVSIQQKKLGCVSINVSELNDRINTLENKGLVEKKTNGYEVNLKKMGYDKLLGAGSTKLKFSITVDEASESAVKKIEAAGGSVSVLVPKTEFVETAEAQPV